MQFRHLFSVFFSLASAGLSGQIGGREVYQFLNITPEARVVAMGRLPIAYWEPDVNFAILNPALIHAQLHGSLSLNAVSFPADIFIGSANYAHHFDKAGTFTLGIRSFQYGKFVAANQFGVQTGEFDVSDLVITLGHGREVYENLYAGANLKIINSAYEQYSSFGLATDLGVTYHIPEKLLTWSLLIRNAGFQWDPYTTERGRLPFDLQIGVSNRFRHLPLRWHITADQLHRPDVSFINPANSRRDPITSQLIEENITLANKVFRHLSFGAELSPTKGFNVAIGYNFRMQQELRMNTRRSSAGLTFGLGFRVSKFMIQYSRGVYHVSGAANLFSVTTRFSDFKKKEKAD
ncbi:type IX secretion system protein PorQ [Thermaurantimonas aggregans]|uniref:type IX secretion system protein PorQ n=1 Tax=Thermaurantimonas aggregans TaxID=2173829 RepID=UPI0023EF6C6D|nr:type IX secretion system protein PorQ [Thermaurantimonas aggregans]MCX8147662.1 type IX secretion system protein PorQ [Thermaurantimonas aggregans]